MTLYDALKRLAERYEEALKPLLKHREKKKDGEQECPACGNKTRRKLPCFCPWCGKYLKKDGEQE